MWSLLLLVLVLVLVLVLRHHEDAEKAGGRSAALRRESPLRLRRLKRATSASILTPSARSPRSIPIRLPAR